jgi:ABC-2 type transport system ATP-binding protein
VEETLRFTGAFYPRWDWEETGRLVDRLGLTRGSRVGTLSRGQRGKLALVAALGGRPDLLILDEPTAGLDAVVRKEFLERTIELAAEEGRTVFFSTHLIDEVERVADRVGILHEGKLVVEGAIDDVKEEYRRVRACFDREVATAELPKPSWSVQRIGRETVFIARGLGDRIKDDLRRLGARHVEVLGLSLEDLFVARTGEEVRCA